MNRFILYSFAVFVFAFFPYDAEAAGTIKITEPADGATFSFSTVLLHGEVSDLEASEVRLVNPKFHSDERFVLGQAYKGRFKVLAPLRKGENELKIRCGEATTSLKLHYEPNENPKFARVVYMTDSTGETEFQTPDGKGSRDFERRLATAMKLMQTMTAERMKDLGYGYRTFNIEQDENDDVVVNVMKGEKTAGEYYDLFDKDQIFGQIYREVDANYPDDSRVLVIPAFTRWDIENQRDRGHTALGGGRLAIFGGATLYCWPTDIETSVAGMLDATRIDKTKIKDDSVGRSVYWACASTSIGASLHELGHAMELPHTTDWTDIMTRGHDHFFRVFLVREAPSAYTEYERWTDYTSDEMARFAPPSATALIMSRWFAENDPSDRKQGKIEIVVDEDRKIVRVRAENKIACVQVIENGDLVFFQAPSPEQVLKDEFPAEDSISFEKLREVAQSPRVNIRVADAQGFFGQELAVQIREESPEPGKQVVQKIDLPKSGEKLAYWVFLPHDYDGKEDRPLLLFLHGSGERGPDVDRVKAHGPPKILQNAERAKDWPMITISPQCPAGKDWSTGYLLELLDEMEKKFKIDGKRIYVTGLGMGGFTTWELLRDAPERFAAGVPICSGFVPDDVSPFLDKPIWVFHGEQDDFVQPESSRKAVDKIKEKGGRKIKLTMYPDVDHFSWRPAYDEAELYRWLLEQKRD